MQRFERFALYLALVVVVCLTGFAVIPLIRGVIFALPVTIRSITWRDVSGLLKASGVLLAAGIVVAVAWNALRGVIGSLFLALAVLCFKDGREEALRLLHQSPPRPMA